MSGDIRTVQQLLRLKKSPGTSGIGSELFRTNHAPLDLPTGTATSQNMQTIEEGQFSPKAQPEQKDFQPKAQSASIFQREWVKYPAIFAVSFAFFYFFLNFGVFSDKVLRYFHSEAPKAQTEGQVLGVVTPDYSAWIGKYFYQANSMEPLSPNVDYDRDGLTNFQEFLLKTNPTKSDTDNDRYSDGQEVLNGYNPLYEGKLTADQQKIIADWDLRDINNRISYNARLALSSSNPAINPLSEVSVGPARPGMVMAINYDLTTPGEIHIPKLGVKAPVVWSKSPDDFSKDLETGSIHYPGTVYPGQVGVSYISAHSSNYVWSNSKYSYVFSRVNELNDGDEFFVTVGQSDGQKLTMRFVVFAKGEFRPDDQAQFEQEGGDAVVNLSTCWPLGSTSKRLIVSARMTGV